MKDLMQEHNKRGISIYAQAAAAMMFIHLLHKLVREIPGGIASIGTNAAITGIICVALLGAGIFLVLIKVKWGLLLGIIPAIWICFQPILVHVIWAKPDINGVWWYPVFPMAQGLLIIYFSVLAWKRWEKQVN